MQLTILAGVSLLSLSAAIGLEARANGGVKYCTDPKFKGTCATKQQPWDKCIQLTSPYYKTISSITPDTYNAVVVYSDKSCSSSDSLTIFNPGYSDLTTVSWNDKIGSYKVEQLDGPSCFNSVNQTKFPGADCTHCCNGCGFAGPSVPVCCPPGAVC